MQFQTTAIHSGSKPNLKEGGSGDVVVPIHLSTTFARKKVDVPTQGLEYSRSGNPTRFALEENLAALENGKFAFAYASGLAAMTSGPKLNRPVSPCSPRLRRLDAPQVKWPQSRRRVKRVAWVRLASFKFR